MYAEDEFAPVSALGHIAFCERRCALMFIENIWDENRFTVEGAQLHEKVHGSQTEVRGDVRIARGLLIKSQRYGLTGKTDVVEFHRVGSENAPNTPGILLPGVDDLWVPFPVEYKHGKLREEESYKVQLCGQVFCLEEMLKVQVSSGAIFYGKPRRRLTVIFDAALRVRTEQLTKKLHGLIDARETPQVRYEKKCRSCSLLNACMPPTRTKRKSAKRYLKTAIDEILSV